MYWIIMIALLLPAFNHASASTDIYIETLQKAPDSCHCVAFRLDDIQDFFTREAQMDIISMFIEEEVPLTLGIIGGFLHEDEELIRFLINATAHDIEFANHGWVHVDHTSMTIEEQRDSIVRTNERIIDLFRIEPKTFIPPENPFNDDTLSIMREVGLTHLSGSIFVDADEPPFPLKNGNSVFHFPQTAFVSNVDTPTGVWTVFPNEEVMRMIRSSFNEYGFAVVVMHPVAHYDVQDSIYTYDRGSIEQLRDLLIEVKKEFNSVKIREMDAVGWIPKDVPRDLYLYHHTTLWDGKEVSIASSKDINIEIREGMILLDSNNIWEEPFLLMLPKEIIQQPDVIAENRILPIMKWFDNDSDIWVVYVDPPRTAGSLYVIPEFDIVLLSFTAAIGILFFTYILLRKINAP